MSEITILAASVKMTLLEIAKQAAALGQGLQNAAPGGANNSALYLINTSDNINKIAKEFEKFQSEKLSELPKTT